MKTHSFLLTGLRNSLSRSAFSLLTGMFVLGATIQAALADSFVVTERAGAKVACFRDEGEIFCDVAPLGNFKVVASMNWKDLVDISTIDGDTTFTLSIGNLNVSVPLSEDPKYVAGKKSAVFVFGHYNDNDKLIVDSRVALRWNAKGFTATVTGRINFEQGSILAEQYTEEDGAFTDTRDLSVSFAGFSLENLPLNITGNTAHKTVFRGQGENREEFEITTVTLKGTPAPTL